MGPKIAQIAEVAEFAKKATIAESATIAEGFMIAKFSAVAEISKEQDCWDCRNYHGFHDCSVSWDCRK